MESIFKIVIQILRKLCFIYVIYHIKFNNYYGTFLKQKLIWKLFWYVSYIF